MVFIPTLALLGQDASGNARGMVRVIHVKGRR